MANWVHQLRALIDPEIPEAIRNEYVLNTASQVQVRGRLLFGALLLTTPTAYFAASPGASLWIRLVTPIAMAVFCLLGLRNLSRDLKISTSLRRAQRLLRESTWSSSLIAVMCSSWCVYSWLGAPPGERIYYPIIIALGAFSTAYCLSAIRPAAVANIVINVVPMIVLLLSSGYRMDIAAAVSLIVAASFQLHMITQHQADIIRLLSLQQQTRELARTDPLTSLLNRRALLDHALAIGENVPLRLMLIDIDHFKKINDRHGHDMGDAVLVAVAEILARRAEIRASVARIGGEEFAILGSVEELPESLALALLADIRTAAMPHGKQVTISLGMSIGMIGAETDWRDMFNRADAALYKAKTNGRNRIEHAEETGAEAASETGEMLGAA